MTADNCPGHAFDERFRSWHWQQLLATIFCGAHLDRARVAYGAYVMVYKVWEGHK